MQLFRLGNHNTPPNLLAIFNHLSHHQSLGDELTSNSHCIIFSSVLT